MKSEFWLYFENGLPKGTAQQKGERIAYRISGGKRVPYIHHYKKANVAAVRKELEYKLKQYAPKQPSDKPIKICVELFFSVKAPHRIWGHFKPTKPDGSNYCKELFDAMTATGYWIDDAQLVDERIKKYYASSSAIHIIYEEVEP